jgi:uncharacterized membrane protein (DUF106 family)
MDQTTRKVNELAEEGVEMTDALEAVLDRAEEKGAIEWSDVSDDITSGQWGRLIETGLLVDGHGNGFVVDDPEGVRDALGDADPSVEIEDDESSWTIYDKIAAVGTLGLFVGYSQQPVRALIGGIVDVVMGPLHAALPFYAVVLVAATFTGLTSTIIQANLMDTEKVGKYQQRMQNIQKRRKEAKERGDEEALDRIQQEQMEAMGDQLGMFKEQFRPTPWMMIINIPIFLWIYWMIFDIGVAGTVVFPMVGTLDSWTASVAGPLPLQAWIVWYFLCSLGFTQIIRKSLDIDMTPTT